MKSHAFSALPTQSLSPWRRGGGGGGTSDGGKNQKPKNSLWLSSTPLGSKINPQENPMPNFLAINFQKAKQVWLFLFAELHSWDMQELPWIFRLVRIPQKTLLNQATPKNTCQIFLPKKSRNQKFQTQKNLSIIPITWNPGYPPGLLA